jgi:plastocyanin
LTVVVTLLCVAFSTLAIPVGAGAQAATPTLYEVEVGHRLNATRNGKRIPATSTRFFPGELNVHKGDVVRFYSVMFLAPVVLLPPPWKPTADEGDPFAWQSKRNNIAYDYDDPWFFVNFDPDDDKPGEEHMPRTKVNNRLAVPPLQCGKNAQTPCPFPAPGSTGDPVNDVLTSGTSEKSVSSGGGPNPFPTTLFVRIEADPGTTIWATMVTALGMNMRINVVADDQPATDPASLAAAAAEQVAIDTQRVIELDKQYSNHHVKSKVAPGVHRYEALAGIEQDNVTILQAYPRNLRINAGDSVVWRADLLPGQYHTVTFPRLPNVETPWPSNIPEHLQPPAGRQTRPPTYKYACDLDTDQGKAPDAPQLLPWPLYCPGFTSQLEIEFPNEIVYRSGDGKFEGPNDWENSGIVGAAPMPAPGAVPYELNFPAASGKEGFRYMCLLHGVMDATVVVE